MDQTLTVRQTQILKSLIDEYIDTAEPIGSVSLEKKYNLGISPATVRNEMVSLTNLGFLRQPHTSAGRVPTPMAMKFYINQLMEEKQMSLTDEVKAKEEVWDVRDNLDELIAEATHALSSRTGNLAIGVTNEGKVFHSGYSNIFAWPEFANITACAHLFGMIEETKFLEDLFFSRLTGNANVEVLFGEDIEFPGLDTIGIVASSFSVHDRNIALGTIGPTRMSYGTIIPIVRYFSNLIREVSI